MTIARWIATPIGLFATVALLVAGGCAKDDQPTPLPRSTTYALVQSDVLGISGQVKFTESDDKVIIDLEMTGASAGLHPAELRMNAAIEGGSVVLMLNPVDQSGTSSTTITSMTYNELIAYDGYIQISRSSLQPNVILAVGDIGGNALTSKQKTYILDTIGSLGVSGDALFQKRVNGNTLVTITITGGISGNSYPTTINLGSVETVGGGPIVKALNPIDGSNNESITNIRKLDSGINITYDNWLVYDGYINVYQGSATLSNVISHGNIGSN